jgi:flagellar basal-body rod modification protein FlgD
MANAIDPTASSTAAAPAQPAAAQSPGSTLGKDTFLKLLVAQMKFQNPMSPTDPSAFMAQTAQFTMVEKLENIDKQSTDLLMAQRSATATGMLGQQVVAAGPDGKDITGIVTGMRITSDGPRIKVDNVEVALTAVKEVDRPTPAA